MAVEESPAWAAEPGTDSHRSRVGLPAGGAGGALLAWSALGGLLACAAAVAIGAAGGTPFLVPTRGPTPAWVVGPLAGLGPVLRPVGFSALLLAMSACYLVVLPLTERIGRTVLVAALVAVHVIAALAPPIVTPDVFSYLAYARVGAVHGLSPYTSAPSVLTGDPVLSFVAFRDLPSPYGPLWTLVSYPLGWIGLPAGVWILKGLTAAAGLGCAALVADIARRLGRSPDAAAALVGLNPVVVLYAVGGAHNDLFVMLLVLAGVRFATTQRDGLGAAGVAAAAGVKLTAGLVLPFLVLGARSRRWALAGALGTGAVLVLAGLAAFGLASVGGYARALAMQQGMVSEVSAPWLLGRLLGQGGAGPAVRLVAGAAFLAALGWQLWRVTRGAEWLSAAAWATLALLLATTWLMPYYLVWLMPLAALGSSALRRAALGVFAFVVLSRIGLLLL